MTQMYEKSIVIRELEKEDAEVVSQIIKILADETNNFPFTSEDYGLDIQKQKIFIDYLSKNENCVLIGAFHQDKICGLIYLEGGTKSRTFHSCNLGMGVLKRYWGKSIGTRLIEKIFDYAYKSECIAKIDIQVKSDNPRAINLYKKLGFEIEGKIRRALFINGEFYDYLLMGKIIE